jgi:hypothetical protein
MANSKVVKFSKQVRSVSKKVKAIVIEELQNDVVDEDGEDVCALISSIALVDSGITLFIADAKSRGLTEVEIADATVEFTTQVMKTALNSMLKLDVGVATGTARDHDGAVEKARAEAEKIMDTMKANTQH